MSHFNNKILKPLQGALAVGGNSIPHTQAHRNKMYEGVVGLRQVETLITG